MAAFDDCCGRTGTRKLCVSRKLVESIRLNKCAIRDQPLPKGDNIWHALPSLLQHRSRTLKHHKAIGRPMPATLSTLHATEKNSASLLLRRWLCDWDEKIGSKHWQKLANMRKKHLHIFAVGLWKSRPASLVLFEREPPDLNGLGDEPALKVSNMSLGKIVVLANKHDSGNPEFLCLVLL